MFGFLNRAHHDTMAQIGQKRTVQDLESVKPTKDDASLTPLSKRPASSANFSFRPSSLNSAAQGFSLRQSSLRPVASDPNSTSLSVSTAFPEASSNDTREEHNSVEKSGFLKLNRDAIKQFDMSAANLMTVSNSKPIMTAAVTSAASTNATSTISRNPFIQDQSSNTPTSLGFGGQGQRSGEQSYFSINTDGLKQSPDTGPDSSGRQSNGSAVVAKDESGHTSTASASQIFLEHANNGSPNDAERSIFGAQSRQLPLPEVNAITGEENEKNIVLISARLYIFEAETLIWRERGRGEVRLNDSAKDEGVFQSRLVMRASGSYRILLNTHLWAKMLCERANQKSIRITAQHISSTDNIGVYLITGASKDIQQLYTAIDRRIQALQRNIHSEEKSDNESNNYKSSSKNPIQEDDEDKEDDSISRQSSPDSSPESIHVRQINRPPTIAISDVDEVQRSSTSEVRSGCTGSDNEGTGDPAVSESETSTIDNTEDEINTPPESPDYPSP